MIEKLKIDEIEPSTRRYPGIIFQQERATGDRVLNIENLSYVQDGEVLFKEISFTIERDDKVVFLAKEARAVTAFFKIISGELEPTTGTVDWGVTITTAYLPSDNTEFFTKDETLYEWLGNYSTDTSENFLRQYLGKMLFSGDDLQKSAKVLSGGEKMRCMIARMMLAHPNTVILDSSNQPFGYGIDPGFQQQHENLSRTSFDGWSMTMSSLNLFVPAVIDLTPHGAIDKYMDFEDYLTDEKIKALREEK